MTKYRKTTLVEAVRTYEGEDGFVEFEKNPDWLVEAIKAGKIYRTRTGRQKTMQIVVKEGVLELEPGAWVVRGANGAIWPLDHVSFMQSYVKVED